MTLPIRDILAAAMRRERYGLITPVWPELAAIDHEAAEEVRRRADHLMRLLSDYGVQLVQTGEPTPIATPTSPTIVANQVYAQPDTMREVRVEGGKVSIVAAKGGIDSVEQTFTMTEVMLNCGLVLSGDPAAKTIKDLGKQLAAACEAYRLNAMGGGK